MFLQSFLFFPIQYEHRLNNNTHNYYTFIKYLNFKLLNAQSSIVHDWYREINLKLPTHFKSHCALNNIRTVQ